MENEEEIKLLYLDGPKPEVNLLSPEPLLAMMGTEESGVSIYTVTSLARHLGCGTHVVHGWLNGQGLSIQYAEQIAHRIGKHPLNIWGQEYLLAIYSDELAKEWSKENKRRRRSAGTRKYSAKESANAQQAKS